MTHRQGLLLAALLCLPFPALSATAIVEWENPTQREDGSPLPLSELARIRVLWGSCASDGSLSTVTGQVAVPSPATMVEIQNIPSGLYCFTAVAVDTEGLESMRSATVQKRFTQSRPKSPRIKWIN